MKPSRPRTKQGWKWWEHGGNGGKKGGKNSTTNAAHTMTTTSSAISETATATEGAVSQSAAVPTEILAAPTKRRSSNSDPFTAKMVNKRYFKSAPPRMRAVHFARQA